MSQTDIEPTLESPTVEPARPARVRRALAPAAAVALSLVFALAAFWLFTRHVDFPLDYHPDEWSKVAQIASSIQPRNLNHPPLMLEAANLARQWFDVPQNDQHALVMLGRRTSAAFAALAVFTFALAGFVSFRFVGLILGGAVVALSPPLLVAAHYFKEDATLIGGIGVATLGITLLVRSRRSWTQLLSILVLGVGAAMTAGAKYVGLAILLPAVVATIIAPLPAWRSRWRWAFVPARLLAFALVAVSSFVFIAQRAFSDPWTLTLSRNAERSFREEFEHGTTAHNGVALPTPNDFCLRVAAGEIGTHAWILLGVCVVAAVVFRRRLRFTRAGVMIIVTLGTFAIMLSFNAIPFARYALPISILGAFAIASAAAAMTRAIPKPNRIRFAVAGVVFAILLVVQGDLCWRLNRQFADDSRQRLREWVAKNVPRGEIVVAETYVNLNRSGDALRFPDQSPLTARVMRVGRAPDAGPLPWLAGRGIRYVIVAEPDYQRYFVKGIRAEPGDELAFNYRKSFYETLFARGTLVWHSKPSPPSGSYVNPEIRVYDISVFKDDPPAQRPPLNRRRR